MRSYLLCWWEVRLCWACGWHAWTASKETILARFGVSIWNM